MWVVENAIAWQINDEVPDLILGIEDIRLFNLFRFLIFYSKILENDFCMGERGKRGGGGSSLRFRWYGGSARKRMLIPGIFYFPAAGAGLGRVFKSMRYKERYKVGQGRQAKR